jgi:hypothetical protein
VLQDVVAKRPTDSTKHLETVIGSFTSASNVAPLCVPVLVFHIAYTTRALCRLRVLSEVAVVRINALVWAQFKLQAQSKNFNIRPVAGRKWPIDPDKVSSADAGPNFIPQTTALELEGEEGLRRLALIRRLAIRTINLNRAIVPNIVD